MISNYDQSPLSFVRGIIILFASFEGNSKFSGIDCQITGLESGLEE